MQMIVEPFPSSCLELIVTQEILIGQRVLTCVNSGPKVAQAA